jgi:hypothetical protein
VHALDMRKHGLAAACITFASLFVAVGADDCTWESDVDCSGNELPNKPFVDGTTQVCLQCMVCFVVVLCMHGHWLTNCMFIEIT